MLDETCEGQTMMLNSSFTNQSTVSHSHQFLIIILLLLAFV